MFLVLTSMLSILVILYNNNNNNNNNKLYGDPLNTSSRFECRFLCKTWKSKLFFHSKYLMVSNHRLYKDPLSTSSRFECQFQWKAQIS